MNARSRLVAGALASLLALGAVACEVDDVDIDDPLEDNDMFEDDVDQ